MKCPPVLSLFAFFLFPIPVLSYPPFEINVSEVPPIPSPLCFENLTISNCLSHNSIPHLLPSLPTYPTLSRAYNLRFNYNPAAIAYPTSLDQVQQTVKCAVSEKLNFAVRGGGHSYGAFGLGGEDGRLIIDMENFQQIEYDASTEVVTVGAGVRLGNLARRLWEFGRAIPLGSCANVGIAGLSLHGGFGFSSRIWGLTLDAITELRGITPTGEPFVANDSVNQDLFWALRGAGSAFAVVTEFKFKTFSAPPTTTFWRYGFAFRTAEDAARLFMEFQEFGREKAPRELAPQIYVDSYSIVVTGNYFGLREEFDRVIKDLYIGLSTIYGREPDVEIEEQAWYENLVHLNGAPIERPLVGFNQFDNFYATSLIVPGGDDLKYETALSLFQFVYRNRESAPRYYFQANLYGGKDSQISATSSNATAYFNRDAFLNFQFYAFVQQNEAFTPDIIIFVQDLVKSITSKQSPKRGGDWPAYVNYVDPTLTFEEAGVRYYGDNLMRLRELKEKFDPEHRLGAGVGI